MKHGWMITAGLLGALGLASPATAQDEPDKRGKKMRPRDLKPASKGRAKAMMKARARDVGEVASPEQVEQVKAAVEARKAADAERGKGKGKARGEGKGKGKGAPEAKKARAAEQRAKAKAELGEKLAGKWTPAVIAQQKRHAKRMAKLARIREIAAQKGDEKTLERVAKLKKREEDRHHAWVEKMAADKPGGEDKEDSE